MARLALPLALLVVVAGLIVAALTGASEAPPPAEPPRADLGESRTDPPPVFSPGEDSLPLPAEAFSPPEDAAARREGESETDALARIAFARVGALFLQLGDVEAYLDAAGEADWELMEVSPELRAMLLRLLTAGDADARLKAALALALIELSPDDVAFLRGRFDAESAAMRGEKAKNLVFGLAFALKMHGERHGVSMLADALRTGAGSDVKGFRNGAVLVLALTSDAESSSLLRELLASDPDRLVRKHSAVGLGRIGGEENRAALGEALGSEQDVEVRAWSALAAGRAAPKAAGDPALETALAEDPAGEVRGASAFALSRAGGPGTVSTLIDAYYGEDHALARVGAIAGVARRGEGERAAEFIESEGSPYLEEVATSCEDRVARFYATASLGLLEPSESRTEALHQVASGDSSSWVRSGAVDAIAKTEGAAAVPYLEGLLETENTDWVRRQIQREIERLSK